jgi:hypothetical protein
MQSILLSEIQVCIRIITCLFIYFAHVISVHFVSLFDNFWGLDDLERTSHLREMQSIGPLKILRGDLDEESSFDDAVVGCEFVFLVAAPVNLMSENPEVIFHSCKSF